MTIRELVDAFQDLPSTKELPTLFVGHGSPLNALEDNVYSRGWKNLGKNIPTPRAVLAISAHWLTQGTFVHVSPHPKTIHDFWGFPEALYDITYPAPGKPDGGDILRALVSGTHITDENEWGLDHGTWVVLRHMYPNADIPVFQMSIDMSQPSAFHYRLGGDLAALRKKGVLIVGSGNIVHNLGNISWEENAHPFDWAETFDAQAKNLLLKGDHQSLILHEKLGHEAGLSIPTPDHYWPLLYILGTQKKDEVISFPVEGIAHGSISMRAVQIGE